MPVKANPGLPQDAAGHAKGNESNGLDTKMSEGPGGDEGSSGSKKNSNESKDNEESKDGSSGKGPKKDGSGDDEEYKEVERKEVTKEDAHHYHRYPVPGKYQTLPIKDIFDEKDLRLAYIPGVAYPCEEIYKNKNNVYKYTNKENTVCVISNGTAVLGLGKIGALAGKPVMEGKGVLLKKFGDVNGVDLAVETRDSDEFINCVKLLGSSFGGINLEDISGPECFYIENKLKEIMDIPVFHDDQHGTAIIVAAGIMNACILTDKKLQDIKVVFNGAGAAGIACLQMIIDCGVKLENAYL